MSRPRRSPQPNPYPRRCRCVPTDHDARRCTHVPVPTPQAPAATGIDPGQLAALSALKAVEAVYGGASLNALRPVVQSSVLRRLSQRCNWRGEGPPGVRPIIKLVGHRASSPTASCREVSVAVSVGARCLAAAVRVEQISGRWQVSALEVG
ncbi:hypothetical protein GCM10010407_01670 [Rarobacter incanus]